MQTLPAKTPVVGFAFAVMATVFLSRRMAMAAAPR
jgi:hypothetical protein